MVLFRKEQYRKKHCTTGIAGNLKCLLCFKYIQNHQDFKQLQAGELGPSYQWEICGDERVAKKEAQEIWKYCDDLQPQFPFSKLPALRKCVRRKQKSSTHASTIVLTTAAEISAEKEAQLKTSVRSPQHSILQTEENRSGEKVGFTKVAASLGMKNTIATTMCGVHLLSP